MPICAVCGEFTPMRMVHRCTGVRIPQFRPRRAPPPPPAPPLHPVHPPVVHPPPVPPPPVTSNVLQVLRSKALDVRGRIEITMTVCFRFRDSTLPERMKMHTAYNKHLVDSYRTNDGYTPKAAPRNTMCRVSLDTFKAAFERYADHLMQLMRANGTGIAPNTIVYTDRSGVYFTSDCAIAGMDIHCFPCLPAATASDIVFDLESQQFADMVKMLRFLYDAGMENLSSKAGDAKGAYDRQHTRDWFKKLFTELEILALNKKLAIQPGLALAHKRHVAQVQRAPKIKSGITLDSMVDDHGNPYMGGWKFTK